MTDTLLEQIKADRENGTPGDWLAEMDEMPCRPRVEGGGKLIAEIGNAEEYLDAIDEWEANTRRISRVPDLEARILRDAETIKALTEVLRPFADYGSLPGAELIPDDHVITQGSRFAAKQITMGDLRAAASTFRAAQEKNDG